jgi:hypothetical protein
MSTDCPPICRKSKRNSMTAKLCCRQLRIDPTDKPNFREKRFRLMQNASRHVTPTLSKVHRTRNISRQHQGGHVHRDLVRGKHCSADRTHKRSGVRQACRHRCGISGPLPHHGHPDERLRWQPIYLRKFLRSRQEHRLPTRHHHGDRLGQPIPGPYAHAVVKSNDHPVRDFYETVGRLGAKLSLLVAANPRLAQSLQ